MMIHDNLLGRIELAALGVLGWLAIALLALNAPTFRRMWVGKIFYVVILLLIALGIPILQMTLTSSSKSQSQINYVFGIVIMEELVAILIVLLITYRQRG
jgi:hypothetical protein